MKTGKSRILKRFASIGLLGVFAVLCFTNAQAAYSTSDNNTPYGSYFSSSTDDGTAKHTTTAWQALGKSDDSQSGLVWSTDGGLVWGNKDLYVGQTVRFQFNMYKSNDGTHYADHLKAWLSNDGLSYDESESIIYKEEKLSSSNDTKFSYTYTYTVTEDDLIDGLWLRARVTCSESLLSVYYAGLYPSLDNTTKKQIYKAMTGTNSLPPSGWTPNQFSWANYTSTPGWYKTYKDMFAATGNYYQGEVEEWNITVKGSQVPEPATMILFGFGLLGLSRLGRKRKLLKG